MKEIVFYARGGQGAVTAAAVLVAALAQEGKYAQAFPFFGGERRGAPVKAFLRIDDKPITTRSQIYKPDCIVVLDSKLPSSMNVYDGLKQGGIAVFNSALSPAEIKTRVPLAKIGTVDANQIADNIFGSMAIPFTNFAMLGAFAATTCWVGLDSIIAASYSKFTGTTAKNNEKSTRAAFTATRMMNYDVQPLPDIASPPAAAARKLKMELLLGMAVNKASTAKTGSWRTRKPLPVDILAPCTDKCPAGVKIRDYLKLVEEGKFGAARQLLLDDNPLPAITGRVCYHPCESGCNRKNFDAAVAVHAIERFIGDYGQETEVNVVAASAAKIAVIGSGPAGLSAAYYLAKKQYNVTIFEALPVSGGMLRVGIPEYRLPGSVLDGEINRIIKMGVTIKNNAVLGKDITVNELLKQGYKAVFIAIGAHKAQVLGIPGEDAKGVVPGVSFLRDIRLGKKVKVGAKTVVIGGGNVAVDAARSAIRLGAKEVVLLYRRSCEEMPADDAEIAACAAEGIKIEFLAAPVEILTKAGKATGMKCVRMILGRKDKSGRRNPAPVPGSEFIVDADMVIPAVGQIPDIAFAAGDKNLKIAANGMLVVDKANLATSRESVYAGGDVVTGPATVVEAIAAGKKAAVAIDAAISGQPLPQTSEREVIAYEDLNTDYFTKEPRQAEPELPAGKRKSSFKEVNTGLAAAAAISEAGRCFHCGACNLCAVCSSLCPEGILTTDELTGWQPDLEQCKGCGICAVECPRGAVAMVLER
jgi:2-oxoacid:acceptor oxidoreductase gamma subunit (pyruvate/2-ketoisovalerate family)